MPPQPPTWRYTHEGMANCFASLASCIAHVREKFPIASLSESLDVDTGTPTGESFPRWLFRGERSCYPKCVSSFRRLQEDTKVPDTVKGELAAITEFRRPIHSGLPDPAVHRGP